MRKFYIGLSRNRKNKIGSALIQKFLKTSYSHTFFKFDTKHIFDDDTIFHSTMSSGVSYWSGVNFEKENITTHLYEIEIPYENYRSLRARLHSHAGEKYAHIQNIGIILVELAKVAGFHLKNPFRDNENCSELVFLALRELHPELANEYSQDTIRPDHVEDIMEKYGYKNVISDT